MRKGIPRKKAIAGKDRIIPHKGHEFRLEMPKEGRFLPEVKIEIDGSNAFCSRGHRWVPGPIQRQGIYKRMIGILEEYEKEMFMERNGFENYKQTIKLDMAMREPYAKLLPETRESARNFLDKLRTPVHLEYTGSYNTISVLRRLGYEIEWFSREQLQAVGRGSAQNVATADQIISNRPELDGHMLFILAKQVS